MPAAKIVKLAPPVPASSRLQGASCSWSVIFTLIRRHCFFLSPGVIRISTHALPSRALVRWLCGPWCERVPCRAKPRTSSTNGNDGLVSCARCKSFRLVCTEYGVSAHVWIYTRCRCSIRPPWPLSTRRLGHRRLLAITTPRPSSNLLRP